MVDKRTLEFILTDQQEEMESRAEEALCQRREETLIDFKSTPPALALWGCSPPAARHTPRCLSMVLDMFNNVAVETTE